ncbi:hypothetical protein C9374_001689 [Naegleria lovaniensis]|uniref:Dynein intermediate chain n=1 Tax=Naegleria lovaniensis TaxID=51637 RepID=A0AA88KRI6_NAELO|nr:uncharacterized protein C9374_001689 [Naegleria lovaniensis]KAG2387357.1 hypothetical protein C9374_001689 [Naegleria lovaniensis]
MSLNLPPLDEDIKSEIEKRKEEIRKKRELLEQYKNKKNASLSTQIRFNNLISSNTNQHHSELISSEPQKNTTSKGASTNSLVEPKAASSFPQAVLMNQLQGGSAALEVNRPRVLQLYARINEIDVAPLVPLKYSKETQSDENFANYSITSIEKDLLNDEGINIDIMDDDDSDYFSSLNTLEILDVKNVEEKKKMPSEDTEKRYKDIISTREFQEFFFKASHYVERCIKQPFDPLVDYTDDRSCSFQANTSGAAKIEAVFFDSELCQHKSVTDLSWSPKFEDLFLVAYSSTDVSHDHEGLVLIWSHHYPKRKENALFCDTSISAAQFYPYNPSLVIGGTYTGQIVIWDLREKTSSPVIRTAISSRTHTEPIFGMEVVGSSENSHNLVTMSTDGRVCTWSMNKLDSPPEVIDLYINAVKSQEPEQMAPLSQNTDLNLQSKSFYSPVTLLSQSMTFPKGEVNRFYVGTENGSIYSAHRFGSKKGANNEIYSGHFAPITSLVSHPSLEFSEIMLSSSMDWTCKLWSHKKHTPLLSFDEFEDYVFDVKWSPSNPSLFAASDGSGCLSLWNINQDQEMPVFKISTGASALNKLQWSNDGKRIATGSISGNVTMLKIDEETAIPKARDLESKLLESIIVDLLTENY